DGGVSGGGVVTGSSLKNAASAPGQGGGRRLAPKPRYARARAARPSAAPGGQMEKGARSRHRLFLVLIRRAGARTSSAVVVRALDGSGNNLRHPDWGKAGTQYLRVASANYADGTGKMVSGPSPRYISNRVFNDVGQNLFSEDGISQWGWAWGQF